MNLNDINKAITNFYCNKDNKHIFLIVGNQILFKFIMENQLKNLL